MQKYGRLINEYAPEQDILYDAMVNYFENPTMTKLKSVNNMSMYICKIHTMLGIEHRYVIAFVYEDNKPINNIESLTNLKWISLQTRTMEKDYDNVSKHKYTPKRLKSLMCEINLVNSSDKSYSYLCKTYPINITLLPKSKDKYEYVRDGNLVVALETYNTIISFIE